MNIDNEVKPGELWNCHGMTVRTIKNENPFGQGWFWEVEIVNVTLSPDHPYYNGRETIKFLQPGARTTWPLGASGSHWKKVRDALPHVHT